MTQFTKSIEFVVQRGESSSSAKMVLTELKRQWCQRIKAAGKTDLWLEIAESKGGLKPLDGHRSLDLASVSLGAFTSPGCFVCHWKAETTGHNVDTDDSDYGRMGVETPPSLVARLEYDNSILIRLNTICEKRGENLMLPKLVGYFSRDLADFTTIWHTCGQNIVRLRLYGV